MGTTSIRVTLNGKTYKLQEDTIYKAMRLLLEQGTIYPHLYEHDRLESLIYEDY